MNAINPLIKIRHTGCSDIILSFEEFNSYKRNLHTVVSIIIDNSNQHTNFIFTRHILQKFVCLREIVLINVCFQECLFTLPKNVYMIKFINCIGLKCIYTNYAVKIITILNCYDLISIGPHIATNAKLHIFHAPNLVYLPRQSINTSNNLTLYLHYAQNVNLSTLQYIDNCRITANLTRPQLSFPKVKSLLCININLYNEYYNIIQPSHNYLLLTNNIYPINKTELITETAFKSIVDKIIYSNLKINSSKVFTVYQFAITQFFQCNNFIAYMKELDANYFLNMLVSIIIKYICIPTKIKLNTLFTLYESIIIAYFPINIMQAFVIYKQFMPDCFSLFCQKIRNHLIYRLQ